jgi:hypothetical protein
MKKIFQYSFLLMAGLSFTQCDDERSFSITPSIGFSSVSASVQEDDTDPLKVTFYSNTTLTEPVALAISVTDIGGMEYGVDYVTEPEPIDGTISLMIDPEDAEPGFTITSLGNTAPSTTRKANFDLVSVQGSGLVLAQAITLTFQYSITEKTVDPNHLTIAAVRAQYTGSTITLSESKFIEGVVTSTNDNVTAKNVFIQDASGGIVLRFNSNNTTAALKLLPGEEVRVPLQGVTLTAFNGLIQLGDGSTTLPHEKIIKLGTQPLPEPVIVTVEQLNSNVYQSMLVKVVNVSFAAADGAKTVSGNNTFSDGSVTSTMRVESYAPFSGKVLPSGSVSITGVASYFNTSQIVPMKESDIQ